MKILTVSVLAWMLCLTTARVATAQKILQLVQVENDSSYVEDHTEDLTLRLFGSRKYTYYDMKDRGLKEEVLYRPNSANNVGFGVNYKFIGLNFAFNLPFINNDNEKYGKTKFLDLQAHLYLRKLVVDFYGQYYKGYYEAAATRRISNAFPRKAVSLRPDMLNTDLGLHVQYIFNDKRFSYRAAFMQNEYQKKSAGSFLLGGEVFTWQLRGDSALVPHDLNVPGFFGDLPFRGTHTVSFAVNGGYAYTLVLARYFFVTASVSAGAGLNHTKLRYSDGRPSTAGWGWAFNNTIRLAAGYNSSYYYFGLHYTDMLTRSDAPVPRAHQIFGTGNLRISIARRLALKKPIF
ncbi:DUF4421 domain-containing protein [Chitinophaga lutea]|uniref:DUF4421 domain-containing protein n=1 Tax=Chitinophaga lutea TaxID=2488634 RepID=A0A3N4Q899_9BACT|nr:DUF4421 domain-containing protein [Chitinophaga lutea]RPE12230.1 DUF4421 domain-containing protein [Chitinophaga lutea]